jgi:hypothetical protein
VDLGRLATLAEAPVPVDTSFVRSAPPDSTKDAPRPDDEGGSALG